MKIRYLEKMSATIKIVFQMSVEDIEVGKTYTLKSPKGVIDKFVVVEISEAEDLIKVDKHKYYLRLSQFATCIL